MGEAAVSVSGGCGMKYAEMNILANEYSDYLRVIRRLSFHTVAAYSGDLARFTAFVESEGLTFPPDRRSARAFAASLNRQGTAEPQCEQEPCGGTRILPISYKAKNSGSRSLRGTRKPEGEQANSGIPA